MTESLNDKEGKTGWFEELGSHVTYSQPIEIKETIAGRLATSMAKNMARQLEPTFFDNLKPEDQGDWLPKVRDKEGNVVLQDDNSPKYVDRRGRLIFLSNKHEKMVFLLSQFITQHINDPDIQDYIVQLNQRDKNGKPMVQNIRISRTIDPRSFAKAYYGRCREEDVTNVYKILKDISEIKQLQVLYYGDPKVKENQYEIRASLIHIETEVWGTDTNDKTRGRKRKSSNEENKFLLGITIQFSPLFFHKVTTDFAYITPKLFELWGNRKDGLGSETEMFPVLLSELCSKYRWHYLTACKVKKEVSNDKTIASKDKPAVLEKRMKAALTYRIYTDTIKSKVATDYSTNNKMKRQFMIHLNQIIGTLTKYGIITDETRIGKKKTDKGYSVDFVFNFDFQANLSTPDELDEQDLTGNEMSNN